MQRRSMRLGFTRTEFLVVIAVVSLLIAVLLPVIQHTREEARRSRSRNNLKSISLALHNYFDTYEVLCPDGVFDDEGDGLNDWTSSLVPYMDANSWYSSAQPGTRRWDDPEQFGYFMLLSESNESSYYTNPTLGPMKQSDGLALNAYSANSWLLYRNSSVSINDERIQNHGTGQILIVADAYGDFAPFGYPTNWRDVTMGHRQSHGFGCPGREITQAVILDGSVRDISVDISQELWRQLAGPVEIRPETAHVMRSWEPYRYPHASFVKRKWIPKGGVRD
ncbi:MAG: DUF1559 domain-containing protein [Planctomycetota bacterium]|nr:MAG: DUF1559 domain-containing protein [Planctomycetota bacterium]